MPLNVQFFDSDRSVWLRPGWRNSARTELPKVPSAAGAYAFGLNQYRFAVCSPAPGSPTMFGAAAAEEAVGALRNARHRLARVDRRDAGELPAAEDAFATRVARVLQERQLVDVVRGEDVPAIGARVGVLDREVERVLRDVDRVAIVGRVGAVAAQRVVQRQRCRPRRRRAGSCVSSPQ